MVKKVANRVLRLIYLSHAMMDTDLALYNRRADRALLLGLGGVPRPGQYIDKRRQEKKNEFRKNKEIFFNAVTSHCSTNDWTRAGINAAT